MDEQWSGKLSIAAARGKSAEGDVAPVAELHIVRLTGRQTGPHLVTICLPTMNLVKHSAGVINLEAA
jgi:hypothetical protein